MDYNQDEEDVALREAIRLSLLEAEKSANNARARQLEQQQWQQHQPHQRKATEIPPEKKIELIDLTDDPEPEIKPELTDYRENLKNWDMSFEEEAEQDEYAHSLAASAAAPKGMESPLRHDRNHGASVLSHSSNEDSDMDEELKLALELSLASSKASTTPAPRNSSAQQPVAKEKTVISQGPMFCGMSRAEMERERQERLRKRAIADGIIETQEFEETRKHKRQTLESSIPSNGTIPGKWHVRFQDLVNKDYLLKAVVTTMDLSDEWLNTYIPLTIPQCRVKHWKADRGEVVPHDWGQLVNTLYVQDFPHLREGYPEQLGEFGAGLVDYLRKLTLPEKIIRAVRRVDFRPAKVLLVPSVSGWHQVAQPHTYGIARLAKVMQTKTNENQVWDLEYQTSSLGKLTVKFLWELNRACRGFEPRARLKVNLDEGPPPIKIVFPKKVHVHNSKLKEDGAGTVCLKRAYWNDATFPRVVMHDFELVGRQRGYLMHTKLILAKPKQPSQTVGARPLPSLNESQKLAGWFYVGSANCTESAWGTMSMKRSGALQGLCINIRNWELGVVYMIETEEEMEEFNRQFRGADDEPDQTFLGPLPIPYQKPLIEYYAEDDPWCDY
ncbi:hypothetical protein FBU30_007089 [Linnemannia zychae]|nr:hypothetical protein FBU30_007089 [Linnemannia zychae]